MAIGMAFRVEMWLRYGATLDSHRAEGIIEDVSHAGYSSLLVVEAAHQGKRMGGGEAS